MCNQKGKVRKCPFHIYICVCVCVCMYTYLLTPWSRVLLEKLSGSAASQEIPRFFGTRRFLAVLTSARHLSLSWANSIQSPQPPPTSWRSIVILSSHLYIYIYIYIILSVLKFGLSTVLMNYFRTVSLPYFFHINTCFLYWVTKTLKGWVWWK